MWSTFKHGTVLPQQRTTTAKSVRPTADTPVLDSLDHLHLTNTRLSLNMNEWDHIRVCVIISCPQREVCVCYLNTPTSTHRLCGSALNPCLFTPTSCDNHSSTWRSICTVCTLTFCIYVILSVSETHILLISLNVYLCTVHILVFVCAVSLRNIWTYWEVGFEYFDEGANGQEMFQCKAGRKGKWLVWL